MSENIVKLALERIHKKNYINSDIIHKAKDWYIQGIQLNNCYLPQWEDMKKIFKKNNLNLNKCGPVITMNEWKNVVFVDNISHSDGIEFITMLHSFPIWSRNECGDKFKPWFEKNRDVLLSFRGTILDIDKKIEELLE